MTLLDLAFPYQKDVILDDSDVKVINFGRQEGKSWTMCFLAAHAAIKKDNALVMFLSTGQRAAQEALRTCSKFADAVKVLSDGKIDYSMNATCITFSNKSRIICLPSNPAALRGWSADLLVLDEVAIWQHPEQCWQAIVPTLLNKINGRDKKLLIASTPLGKNSLFYKLCQQAKTEDKWRYFEVPIEKAIEQGLPADLEALHQLVPDPNQFATEFQCKFAEKASQLVALDELQYFDADMKCEEYFIGADWARHNDGSAIAVLGRDKAQNLYLVDLLLMHNIDYARQVAAAKEMFNRWKPRLFYGDANGLGGPLMEQLNREVNSKIKGFTFTHASKNSCYEIFRKDVLDRKLKLSSMHKDQIVEDLLLVQQIISDNGQISYVAQRSGNSHADSISALVLACKAADDCRPQFKHPVGMMPFSVF